MLEYKYELVTIILNSVTCSPTSTTIPAPYQPIMWVSGSTLSFGARIFVSTGLTEIALICISKSLLLAVGLGISKSNNLFSFSMGQYGVKPTAFMIFISKFQIF